MEGTGRISKNLIIGSRGIKHTEAVMVLGGEKKVFETAILSQLRPFIRTEFNRIEGFVGIDILLFEGFNIGPVTSACDQEASPSDSRARDSMVPSWQPAPSAS